MLALTLTVAMLAAADPTEAWVEASRAYRAGDFAAAVTRYESLLAAGLDSADLRYNLGNAYLRQGELGAAIASYLEAQALAPRDQDVRENLAFARQAAVDALAPPEPSAVLRTLFFWHYGSSRVELLTMLALASLAFWTALSWWRWRRGATARRVALVMLVLLAALAPSALLRTLAPSVVTVVKSAELDVHAGVDEQSITRFRLHAGAEARVVAREDGWTRLQLSDGKQGWVRDQDVIVVTR